MLNIFEVDYTLILFVFKYIYIYIYPTNKFDWLILKCIYLSHILIQNEELMH